MNISYKTAIRFQNLYSPVKMLKVSRDSSIELNQLCKESKERIRYKKYCPSCNKEITSENIVKGYRYNESDFVVITNEDVESIKTEDDSVLNVLYFCKPREISDLLIDRSYYLIPEIDGEEQYNLFRKAMISDRVIAISEIVLGTKQELVALFPTKNCIIATILFYENEINDLSIMFKHKTKSDDLNALKETISENTRGFDWSSHYDKYQERLRELIMSKIPK